jgi:hypothetical protein
MDRVNERIRVACHEAGHATAAVLLGVRLERVQVTPRPRWVPEPGQHDQGQMGAVSLAGQAAEGLLLGGADQEGGRKDHRQARGYALSLGGDPLDMALDAHRQAREVIGANADHVAALACLLLLKGRLSGDEVARVLNSPPPRRSRLGLAALGTVMEVKRGNAWLDQPRRCSRQHYRRQVREHGTWFRALYCASRALCGRRATAMALSLASAAVEAHPTPPAPGG